MQIDIIVRTVAGVLFLVVLGFALSRRKRATKRTSF
jgi:hypothetical protein